MVIYNLFYKKYTKHAEKTSSIKEKPENYVKFDFLEI